MIIAEPSSQVNPPELPDVLISLRDRAGAVVELSVAPTPLRGGFWAEMWVLHLRPSGPLPERVVLRIAPDAVAAQFETAVQAAVFEQGFPTPQILAVGQARGCGRHWTVMEFAHGQPLLADLSGLRAITRLPTIARQLPASLATVSAALHALDRTPVVEALSQCSDPRIGVDGLLAAHAATAEVTGDAMLARAVARVSATRPSAGPDVVCHGDLHPFNILRSDRCLTVLDWTAARIADREYDIAFTAMLLANPPLQAPAIAAPLIDAAARRLARHFVRAYERMASVTIDPQRLEWFTDLHRLRVLAELASWRHEGTLEQRRGHPWLTIAPRITQRFNA